MINELLNYQVEDAKLRKIEVELSNSEARKKAVNAKKYLDGVEEMVNKLDAKASNLMQEYENLINEQIKLKETADEFNHALNELADENGASFIVKKIEEVLAKIKRTGEKVDAIGEEIQSVLKEYMGVKATTKKAQEQYAQSGKEYNDLKDSKKDEREILEKNLKEIEKKVEPSLMERYLEKRKNKIFPIVYEASGDFCGACGTELPLTLKNKLKAGEVIDCANCGRILYKK